MRVLDFSCVAVETTALQSQVLAKFHHGRLSTLPVFTARHTVFLTLDLFSVKVFSV